MRLRLVGTIVTLAAILSSGCCCWHRHHYLFHHRCGSCACESGTVEVGYSPASSCGCGASLAPPLAASPMIAPPMTSGPPMSGAVYSNPGR